MTETPLLVLMASEARPGDRWHWSGGAWKTLASVTLLGLHIVRLTTPTGTEYLLPDRLIVVGRPDLS